MKKSTNTELFLNKHKLQKSRDGDTDEISFTHTKFKNVDLKVFPASYYIPNDKLDVFYGHYMDDCFIKGNEFYLTEKQICDEECSGPILVDLDFRYDKKIESKQHSKEDTESIIGIYLNSLKEFFVFTESTKFNVYIFEKPHINVEHKNDNIVVKDGIHILIDIQCHRNIQNEIRNEVLNNIHVVLDKLPLKNINKDGNSSNKYHDIVDESISRISKPNNWCLYGSRKPGNEAYKMIYHYSITYKDNEFNLLEENDITEYSKNIDKFKKISARYRDNLILEKTEKGTSICEKIIKKKSVNVNNNSNNIRVISIHEFLAIENITSIDELQQIVNKQMDCDLTITNNYNMKEAHDYTMILPDIYYDRHPEWIRVGWALKNTDVRLFGTWMLFSAKSTKFNICDISKYRQEWEEFNVGEGCLTSRSIIYWAKSYYESYYDKDGKPTSDNEYEKLRTSSIDYYIEKAIEIQRTGITNNNDKERKKEKYGTDFDMGRVLWCMYKDNYICVDYKANEWYAYKNNHWKPVAAEAELLLQLSQAIHDLFQQKMVQTVQQMFHLEREDSQYSHYERKIGRIVEICHKLKDGPKKSAIFKESKLLFYDDKFYDNADKNNYLLCFNNGVYDFKNSIFRKGYPDDYLTKSTNIDYIPYEKAIVEHKKHCEGVRNFIRQIYPVDELHDWIWNLFASLLIGGNKMQKFYIFIGCGSNGKSLLLRLIELMMGDYFGELDCSILTQKDKQQGQASPEVMALRGLRVTVTNEIAKGAVMNEATMKQLTGGTDKISGRELYGKQKICFTPQFKPIVLTNNLYDIRSTDTGTWRRIDKIDHLSYFTPNPVDNDPQKPYQYKVDYDLEEKYFDKWKLIFMSMLVDLASKTKGKVPSCNMVKASTDEYRNQQDHIAEFISEKIVVSNDDKHFIKKRDLQQEFDCWMLENHGKKMPKLTKELGTRMDAKFGKYNKKWKNVKLIMEEEDDEN